MYAGEAVGLVTQQQSAGDVIQHLGDGAEHLLRERSSLLLEGHEASCEEQSALRIFKLCFTLWRAQPSGEPHAYNVSRQDVF
jgi:hypothetical protein